MGLRQGDLPHRIRGLFSGWLPILAVTLVTVVLGLFGDAARDLLAFDRQAIAAGALWRLISAHFVHLGFSHLVFNLAGLGLVWFLVGNAFSHRQWLLIWSASIAAVAAGLWVYEPQLAWYVGLSGVIHGLLAAGVAGEMSHGRLDTWVLAAAVVGKIAWEQYVGPLPGSEQASGGTVIVNAHLYGAVGGLLGYVLILIRVRTKASI
jgi:rhomboid family GlyGly-CTERM serine protease